MAVELRQEEDEVVELSVENVENIIAPVRGNLENAPVRGNLENAKGEPSEKMRKIINSCIR